MNNKSFNFKPSNSIKKSSDQEQLYQSIPAELLEYVKMGNPVYIHSIIGSSYKVSALDDHGQPMLYVLNRKQYEFLFNMEKALKATSDYKKFQQLTNSHSTAKLKEKIPIDEKKPEHVELTLKSGTIEALAKEIQEMLGPRVSVDIKDNDASPDPSMDIFPNYSLDSSAAEFYPMDHMPPAKKNISKRYKNIKPRIDKTKLSFNSNYPGHILILEKQINNFNLNRDLKTYNFILDFVEYPKPYPDIITVESIHYIGEKLLINVVDESNNKSGIEPDQMDEHYEPGYGIQQSGHVNSGSLNLSNPELAQRYVFTKRQIPKEVLGYTYKKFSLSGTFNKSQLKS